MSETIAPPAAAPPPPPAAAPPSAPTSPPPPPAPAVLQVHAEDWHAVQKELSDLRQSRAAEAAEKEAKQREATDLLAARAGLLEEQKKERAANELRYAEMRGRFESLNNETLAAAHADALATALAGLELVGDDAEERGEMSATIRRLLADEIEAVRDGANRIVVRDKKTHMPAGEYLKDQLTGRRFHRFIKASAKPGSGSGPNLTRTPPGTEPAKPGSLDSIVADWRQRQQAYQSFGLRGTPAVK